MQSYPTTYKGIRFRSRTEARWAALFDNLEWDWIYEPCDFTGWIPDFQLLLDHEPLLVEVKPALSYHELRVHLPKVQRSGCPYDVLLVGATWWFGQLWDTPEIGVLSDFHAPAFVDRDWVGASLVYCDTGHYGLVTPGGNGQCRTCGLWHIDGTWSTVLIRDWQDMWAAAQNLTQWKPR